MKLNSLVILALLGWHSTASLSAAPARAFAPVRGSVAPAPVAARRALPSRPVVTTVQINQAARNTKPVRPGCPPMAAGACAPRKGCPPGTSACGLKVAVSTVNRGGGLVRRPAAVAPAMSTATVTPSPAKVTVVATAPVRPPVAVATVPPAVAVELRAAREAKLAAADQRAVAFQFSRAGAGCPQAQYDLALRHLSGRGVPVDECAAMSWLDQAARAGHRPAQALAETFVGK